MIKDAIISQDEKYRYRLWRIWDQNLPTIFWIMLNLSTADANNDDPTIKKCIGFSEKLGFGGMYIGNLYPFRATNPKDLRDKSESELFGNERNEPHLCEMYNLSTLTIFARGLMV
jgi:hypothetical protein